MRYSAPVPYRGVGRPDVISDLQYPDRPSRLAVVSCGVSSAKLVAELPPVPAVRTRSDRRQRMICRRLMIVMIVAFAATTADAARFLFSAVVTDVRPEPTDRFAVGDELTIDVAWYDRPASRYVSRPRGTVGWSTRRFLVDYPSAGYRLRVLEDPIRRYSPSYIHVGNNLESQSSDTLFDFVRFHADVFGEAWGIDEAPLRSFSMSLRDSSGAALSSIFPPDEINLDDFSSTAFGLSFGPREGPLEPAITGVITAIHPLAGVPEPTTMWLGGAAFLIVDWRARRRCVA